MLKLTTTPLDFYTEQQLKELPIIWITKQTKLHQVLDDIDTCDIIALDTEFIKRNTFFPRLALIQINTGKTIYLLDAPKLYLDEFWEVIAEVPTLVFHACGEDLGIYYLLSNLPALTNVFDTQIGLSFLTGERNIGYQKSLIDVLNVQINKEQSQSDWLKRPLTYEQEQYAADDVRYLLALFYEVKQQLINQNMWHYAVEDSQSYTQELYNNSQLTDKEIYLTFADFRYSRQQLAILQAICEWREQLVKAINKPRSFILKKQVLRDIVENSPNSMRQLGFCGVSPEVIRMYGGELLTIISNVKRASPETYPLNLPQPYRNLAVDIQQLLDNEILQQSQNLGIHASILMRKKWLLELYAFSLDPKYPLSNWLIGWRQTWINNNLMPILQKYIQSSPLDDWSEN